MNVQILEETKPRIIFEIDEDHAFCNALKDELIQNDDVKIASYSKRHPLVDKPRFIVETNSGSARDAVVKAAKNLAKNAETTKDQAKKELK
ncbi:MAG: DNA-directed RNA polymerase subunit L [Candidatus Woesearchaeota archaeon]